MRIRQLVAVPFAAALSIGALTACNDPAADPAPSPEDTMEEEEGSMEEETSDDSMEEEDATEDEGSTDDTMEDETMDETEDDTMTESEG
jgi:hypothetical protein